LKIEVITNPSARYESAGSVINIVLKKLENEGVKGSLSVSNSQIEKTHNILILISIITKNILLKRSLEVTTILAFSIKGITKTSSILINL
jgi:virulence-associated protein VapD